MAYNESGALSPSQDYTLGNYTFQLRSNYDGDEDVTGIVARMTINGQTSVKGIDIDGQATVESWSVEANESEATVYAAVNRPGDNLMIDGIPIDTPTSQFGANTLKSEVLFTTPVETANMSWSGGGGNLSMVIQNNTASLYKNDQKIYTARVFVGQSTQVLWVGNPNTGKATPAYIYSTGGQDAEFAGYWDAIEYIQDESLIGRFAIDIHEAGGTDPEEWDEPIDYEEGWEEGDPTHTLKVTIKGATSGRHNDPLNDPSYSYLPADNTTQKAYGCGGDGGYGGGGGAGASTVIVYKFATDKANSKEVTAIARGHGYGSGGGKGGKGGDGCIIVYY